MLGVAQAFQVSGTAERVRSQSLSLGHTRKYGGLRGGIQRREFDPSSFSLRQRPFVGRSPSRTDFKNGLIFGPFHFRCVAGSTLRAPGVGSPETIFSRPPYHPVLVRSLLASILLRPTGRFRFEVRNLPPQPSLARNRISKFESRRGNTAHILQAALARPVASPTLRRGFRHRAFNAPVKRIVD